MKHNIELLKADIQNELAKLDLINKEVERVADKFELDDEQVSAYDRAAIGYFLHNFYNGCENIFLSIAKFFENDLKKRGRYPLPFNGVPCQDYHELFLLEFLIILLSEGIEEKMYFSAMVIEPLI